MNQASIQRNCRSIPFATRLILPAVALAGAAPACADPGLGGLAGFAWLLLIGMALFALGLLVILPGLVVALRRKRADRSATRAQKVLVGTAVAYLVLMLPVVFGLVSAPRFSLWQLGGLLLFLLLLNFTLLYFFDNRKAVFGVIAAVGLLALLRMPALVSYTRYEVIDNDPLDDPVLLLEQIDSEYLPLADGRFFYLEERFNSSGPGNKFPPGTRFVLEETPETGVYYLHGVAMSQALYEHGIVTPDALITIPLKTVTLPASQSRIIGKVRLLDADWQADYAALHRAVSAFCCDPDWIAELIARGADGAQNYARYGWTLLHTLAWQSPYSEPMNRTARLLIANGADVNTLDRDGQSVLHDAVLAVAREVRSDDQVDSAQRDFLALLLESGANPNTVGSRGNTPLYDAVSARLYSVAQLLLRHGADPAKTGRNGSSALDLATEHRDSRNIFLTDAQRSAAADLVREMRASMRAGTGKIAY